MENLVAESTGNCHLHNGPEDRSEPGDPCCRFRSRTTYTVRASAFRHILQHLAYYCRRAPHDTEYVRSIQLPMHFVITSEVLIEILVTQTCSEDGVDFRINGSGELTFEQ